MKRIKKVLSILMIAAMVLTSTSVFAATSVAAPKKVSAKRAASLSVKVKWNKVKGADKYQIYRSKSKNGAYRKIKTVGSSKNTFTNKSLKNSTRYYYKVRAINVVGSKTIKANFQLANQQKQEQALLMRKLKK